MAKAKKATTKKTTAKKKTGTRKKSGLTQMSYSLSPELQAVVGAKSLTRPQIVKKLWAYIKSHKCQNPNNRRQVIPDAKLAEVFGSKKPVAIVNRAPCWQARAMCERKLS